MRSPRRPVEVGAAVRARDRADAASPGSPRAAAPRPVAASAVQIAQGEGVPLEHRLRRPARAGPAHEGQPARRRATSAGEPSRLVEGATQRIGSPGLRCRRRRRSGPRAGDEGEPRAVGRPAGATAAARAEEARRGRRAVHGHRPDLPVLPERHHVAPRRDHRFVTLRKAFGFRPLNGTLQIPTLGCLELDAGSGARSDQFPSWSPPRT